MWDGSVMGLYIHDEVEQLGATELNDVRMIVVNG